MTTSPLLSEIEKQEPSETIWQEAIRLSEQIETEYEAVFDQTLTAISRARHSDTLDALATCLLEHLLERDFSHFNRIETEIRCGNDKLLYSVAMCRRWKASALEDSVSRMDAVLDEFKCRLTKFIGETQSKQV